MWCTCVDVYHACFQLDEGKCHDSGFFGKIEQPGIGCTLPFSTEEVGLCSLRVARHDNLDRRKEKRRG